MYPLTDNAWLVDALAEVTSRPREQTRRTLGQVQRDPQAALRKDLREWGIEPYVWTPRLREYYEQTDSYLFGSVVWNRNRYKTQLREWIGEYLAGSVPHACRVLIVGDGVGFDSLYLAQCGYRVSYFEIGEKCQRFSKMLFDTCGQVIQMIRDPQQIEAGDYDAVLCLDVLEHIPDPRAMVAGFVRCLRHGGLLIVHAPFYFVSRANPTHLACNRKYSGDLRQLYESQGFRLRDGRLGWDPLVLEKVPPDGVARVPARRGRLLAICFVGWLLAVGRYWCGPHNLIASLAVGSSDRRWLEGLE
jgi:SAM-dependent methyltransferase